DRRTRRRRIRPGSERGHRLPPQGNQAGGYSVIRSQVVRLKEVPLAKELGQGVKVGPVGSVIWAGALVVCWPPGNGSREKNPPAQKRTQLSPSRWFPATACRERLQMPWPLPEAGRPRTGGRGRPRSGPVRPAISPSP